jgi:hypothetical protein
MIKSTTRIIVPICVLSFAAILAALGERPSAALKGVKTTTGKTGSVNVKVVAVGLSQVQLDAVEKALPRNRSLAPLLQGANYRLLYSEPVEGRGVRTASDHFRTVFYDYTRQRAIVVQGSFGRPDAAVAHVIRNWQPFVNDDEFHDAVTVLMADPVFGPALNSRAAMTYRPMPPVQGWEDDGPVTERIVNVGLLPQPGSGDFQHEIVGVNLARRSVVRYPARAPSRCKANPDAVCGARNAHQSTTHRGTAGQYQLTVTDMDGTVLWDMLVLRPAISSGTNASGIELQNVTYKGHTVLKRAHVPILNILYVNGECGPYRDWLYQEGMFQADGTDIVGAPGFRDCGTTPATTVLETGNDTGNFRGVALYRVGTEVVLVTEMEAGWYRYIHEWGFDADGTIHPRFGFGAVANSCTCLPHTHHAYFRFDFDIDGPPNSIVELPLGVNPSVGTRIASEEKILRDSNSPKYYRISNGKHSYLLYPGTNDGSADAYGVADMWFLHWHDGPTPLEAEIDDGHGYFDPTQADLDQFLTGEGLRKEDSVIWYHASYLHTPDNHADGRPQPANGAKANTLIGPDVVGPDLVPDGF